MQPRIILEEETSTEELISLVRLACGHVCESLSWLKIDVGRAQSTVGGTITMAV